ncbi:integrase catalytic domain-containing protein [Trichonephila clavata]|uniref:Integrase catalytic domain-containing protein n=1 Tax=Trichonephila clavata TaxID=2740835 RepID=A0A8X6ID88_TRICU|nr:integrase catalytic domain-containing protein [Trichonephila clavata]
MERENENLKREIESQKKKRTVVRQLRTKLMSKIETNLSAYVADAEKKEILEDLKVQLEFKMSELRSLDEKIENHVPESEFENEITSSQEYQEKIVSVQGKIQRLLNRKLNSERRSEADNNEIKETVIVKSSENRAMNLPHLQIETFYGDSKNCKRNKCKIVEVTLKNVYNPEKKTTFELMVVPIITTAEIRIPEEKIKQQLQRQGICLIEPSVEKCEPEIGILIGVDVLWSITSSEIKRINKSCVAI